MRNPERLDKFYSKLRILHKEYFTEQRFGQLMSNFFGWLMSEKKRDMFFPEEDEMIEHLEEYCLSHSMWIKRNGGQKTGRAKNTK